MRLEAWSIERTGSVDFGRVQPVTQVDGDARRPGSRASRSTLRSPPLAGRPAFVESGDRGGLIYTSQQLGGAIGVAVASTITATRVTTLLHQGAAPAAALTGGFRSAFWACGAIGFAAVPVTFLLIRRTELAKAVASATARGQTV